MTANEKAARLRSLHHGERPVLFANCWDVASAKTLEQAGFPAVATSSAAIANTLGYADGQRIARADMLAAVERIARAVSIPVSADCEAGYRDDPAGVGETAALMWMAGAVGMNLEDSADDESRLVSVDLQVAKLRAVRAAVPAMVVNARVDAFFLHGAVPADPFAETVQRARAYRDAGADCIFVPGLQDLESIRRLLAASPGPLNILGNENSASVDDLARAGVKRISLGSRPYLAALALLRAIGEDLRGHGSFARVGQAIPYAVVNGWFHN